MRGSLSAGLSCMSGLLANQLGENSLGEACAVFARALGLALLVVGAFIVLIFNEGNCLPTRLRQDR